jgi:nucleoid DNA-binding protein
MPPTLTRRLLLIRLARALPQFPADLVKAGLEEIIASLAQGLISGSPIILRGFGRLQLRCYQNSRKKAGVIFRPSPALIKRLNSTK